LLDWIGGGADMRAVAQHDALGPSAFNFLGKLREIIKLNEQRDGR